MSLSGKISVIRVKAGDTSYPVYFGSGPGKAIYRRVAADHQSGRFFLVIDANLFACHGRALKSQWHSTGKLAGVLVIPSGENYKSPPTVVRIHDWLIGEGASREDVIVACGGGVTSDVVGFAAATLFRGVRWGICATTLLSMVDASIGGKTGINHRLGKNLVGAFWQPSFVIDDLEWLSTQSPREFRSGAAEIIKCAGLAGGELLSLVRDWAATAFVPQYPRLRQIISATISYKASVVSRDERDMGVRLALNYGHTIGHAIELALSYKKLTHGEAVLLGMLAALHAGEEAGVAHPKSLAKFREIVQDAASQLPKVQLSLPDIMSGLKTDKKRLKSNSRFVLLRRPGRPVIRELHPSDIESAVTRLLKDCQSK